MSAISDYFLTLGEPYASGIFEEPDASYQRRYCRAERRFWESRPPIPYSGGRLYPSGVNLMGGFAVVPNYCFTFSADYAVLPEKARDCLMSLPQPRYVNGLHSVGGNGYIHSIPNYARVADEGLDSYQKRVDEAEDRDFASAMTDVIEGVRDFHRRSIEYLEKNRADRQLIDALKTIPFKPARNLYEAIVCWNFVYYLDGCDNPGRLDADLIRWYAGEDATGLLREYFVNVDVNNGWTGALGPDYNPLTGQCLKAVKGMRRPSLELRVTDEMPAQLWETAAETVMSGGGQPSFYNEKLYQEGFRRRFPDKPPEDLKRFCGGGCTESTLAGISNVGSLDAGINTALIFREYMEKRLPDCPTFDEFFDGYVSIAEETIRTTLDEVSRLQKDRAEFKSQPMRTLLVDDCVKNERDFLAGGARHYWSVVNLAGMINVIDSMLAVKSLVYDRGIIGRDSLVGLLDSDDAAVYRLIRSCPAYGRGEDDADSLGRKLLKALFGAFDTRAPYLGGAFLPSSIQFVTYADAGKHVGATPDGRHSGDPLCDSVSAIHGSDTKGVTAMLSSAASMPFDMALGTPVTNLSLSHEHVRLYLRPIVESYFKMGGMQLQITCQSREDMLDAVDHPENHQNLIVRIGGYSEYFNRLSPELQKAVIGRAVY